MKKRQNQISKQSPQIPRSIKNHQKTPKQTKTSAKPTTTKIPQTHQKYPQIPPNIHKTYIALFEKSIKSCVVRTAFGSDKSDISNTFSAVSASA